MDMPQNMSTLMMNSRYNWSELGMMFVADANEKSLLEMPAAPVVCLWLIAGKVSSVLLLDLCFSLNVVSSWATWFPVLVNLSKAP